jgi:hypothetical protein
MSCLISNDDIQDWFSISSSSTGEYVYAVVYGSTGNIYKSSMSMLLFIHSIFIKVLTTEIVGYCRTATTSYGDAALRAAQANTSTLELNMVDTYIAAMIIEAAGV